MEEASKEPTENRFYRRFTGITCGPVTRDRARKNGLKVESQSDVSEAIALIWQCVERARSPVTSGQNLQQSYTSRR